MNISEIRITLLDQAKLKGIAKVTFDGCFVVRDLRVILGTNGYFVAMPNQRLSDGSYKDIVHPTNIETRKHIEDAVLNAYNTQLRAVQPDGNDGSNGAQQISMGGD